MVRKLRTVIPLPPICLPSVAAWIGTEIFRRSLSADNDERSAEKIERPRPADQAKIEIPMVPIRYSTAPRPVNFRNASRDSRSGPSARALGPARNEIHGIKRINDRSRITTVERRAEPILCGI